MTAVGGIAAISTYVGIARAVGATDAVGVAMAAISAYRGIGRAGGATGAVGDFMAANSCFTRLRRSKGADEVAAAVNCLCSCS